MEGPNSTDDDVANSVYSGHIIPGVVDPDKRYLTGLILALCSSVFVGGALVLKRKSFINLVDGGQGSSGKLGYLGSFTWWIGFLSMAIGTKAF